tara:strand:+ start:52016 stop:53398 length:1383 start_codon:yes stop_codon:yes gene_type:complete
MNDILNQKGRRLWIKDPLSIFMMSKQDANGGIVIEGDKIAELIPSGRSPSLPVDQTFNAKEYIILPGLINTHHHFYQTLSRAFIDAQDKALFPWLESSYPLWANLDHEMIFASTQTAIAELLLSGCTTSVDHHYIFSEEMSHAIDIQIAASKEMGGRVTLCRGSMSLGKRDGGLPPNNIIQSEDNILEDSERLLKKYHDKSDGSFNQIALAPCSPFSVSEELMVSTAKLARQYNVKVHTHLAETIDEENFCLEKFDCKPVDYLEKVGWLNNNTWLAHGIHFSNAEIKRLGEAGIGISHCPTSNMILSSGICKTEELLRAGSRIGIGVDGSASNDASNMIIEVRQALLLQRLKYGAENVSHKKTLEWATKGSADIIGRQDIGEISVGKNADLALFKHDELQYSGSHDPLASLILSGTNRADRVMVAGEWVVSEGKLLQFDEKELMMKQNHQTKRLLKKYKK